MYCVQYIVSQFILYCYPSNPSLDVSDPANYRPISNLNTISKILERLVLIRLVPHASTSSNFDAVRSAYKGLHATKTALHNITDDIFAGFGNHQSTILVTLDQSAAFDCVEHETLVSRIEHTFGVTESALDWICSYLEARSTFARWKQNSSYVFPLDTGVSQGSSFGPFLFRCTSHRYQPSSIRSVLVIISTLMTLKSTSQCRMLTYQTK